MWGDKFSEVSGIYRDQAERGPSQAQSDRCSSFFLRRLLCICSLWNRSWAWKSSQPLGDWREPFHILYKKRDGVCHHQAVFSFRTCSAPSLSALAQLRVKEKGGEKSSNGRSSNVLAVFSKGLNQESQGGGATLREKVMKQGGQGSQLNVPSCSPVPHPAGLRPGRSGPLPRVRPCSGLGVPSLFPSIAHSQGTK